jgi:hypothetical protein
MNHIQALAENVLWAQPRAPIADLRDFLDKRHGDGAWTYRTTAGTGTDCKPALDDALDALRARYGRAKLLLPPTGLFRFTSGITAAKLSGIKLEGLGSQASKVVFDADSGTLFDFTGAGAYTAGGVAGIGGFLEEGHASSTAEIVRLDGDATNQPDQFSIEDLYFSRFGTSQWGNGLVINGMDRTSPQGVRIGTIRNFQAFCCRLAGIQIYNAVGWTLENVGVYSGSGAGNDVTIGGGGASNTNTVGLDIRGLVCSGQLSLSNATSVTIFGKAGSVVAASSFDYHAGVVVSGSALSGALGPKGTMQVIT